MKNLKRIASTFVSVILVMALLVGCGGSSSSGSTSDFASRLRSTIDAKQSDSLDKVAEALVDVELTADNAASALTANGYNISTINTYDSILATTIDSSSDVIREDFIEFSKLQGTEQFALSAFSYSKEDYWGILYSREQALINAGYENVESELYLAVAQVDSDKWITILDYVSYYTE